ncbi:MAG: portal protein [Euryarchaeota archaeon TMED85]|nr:MAG: portal protein [Euryarchaeota archaeon TMED85]RPG76251.1 MAG: portal protein [Euryarchaeota archaeon TMED85]|tara:strand:+ start:6355 stop:7878 length:1524 start_codon:yes stop_codon:yes gene_type:complete
MAELFGFRITRANQDLGKDSITTPSPDDGSYDISGGGFYSSILDIAGKDRSDLDLINRYRSIAQQPECDSAIEDIVNESIVSDEKGQSVSLALDRLNLSQTIKNKIREEFDEVLRLLDFNEKGHDIFRRWYVDGRIYYHKIIDSKNTKKGIQEVRYIDPRKIKKVRDKKVEKDQRTGLDVIRQIEDFYLYNEKGLDQSTGTASGVKLTADSISYCPSGLIDMTRGNVLSHLNKAIKPVNQLRMIEDALVIYRISRAPERRIFYIDVGNLPKVKAEAYLKDVMNRYRNKLVYDAKTGEIRDDRNHMSMLEDFWLPRREGGRGTEITTLPGGSNLGEIDDIQYFQKKLYRSLNVPVSRLAEETGFQIGRSDNITRDELKFTKFVQRLRKKFSNLFSDMLKTQLVLKGVIAIEEWPLIKELLQFDYLQDGHFTELKNAELMQNRLDMLGTIESYVGTYFSKEYVRKHILRMSDDEIQEIEDQIKDEEGGENGDTDTDGMFATNEPSEGEK